MQISIFSILTTLALTFASVNAEPIPQPLDSASQSWAFSIYQGENCTEGPPFNATGTGSDPCTPPLEYYLRAVKVASNAGGKCTIAFYSEDSGTKCSGLIQKSPGAIPVGKCHNFPASHIPLTYGVVCK